MALDLDAIAARFKRAARPLVPPAVTGQDRAVYSNTEGSAPRAALGAPAPGSSAPPGLVADRPAPEGPPSARRPRRRRWLPSSPAERRQEPVDPPPAELYPCPFCKRRHQPAPMHLTGASVAYGRSLLPEPGQGRRPIALGRETGHTGVLVRDSFRPWSPSPAAEPIPPAASLRERVARRWAGDGDEPMT